MRNTGDEMDGFSRFFPGGTEPDPAAIRAAGLAARPFPEYASRDEIVAVAGLVNAERADCRHFGYETPPGRLMAARPDEAARHAFDFGYLDVLIAFEAARTFIWLPDHHEFFVIFAPPAVLEKIRAAGIFAYDYDDYAHEAYFAGRRSEFLIAAGRRYTIDPSGEGPDAPIARP